MNKDHTISEGRLKLIRFLRSVPPNLIYDMAPALYVKRGYDYYRRGHFKWLKWNGKILIAGVMGNYCYKVRISLKDDHLQTTCNCPAYLPLTNCKHVICAIVSLKHLLCPGTFLPSPFDSRDREDLLDSLGLDALEAEDLTKLNQRLILVFSVDKDDIFYERNGQKINYTYNLPRSISNLLFKFLTGNITKNDIQEAGVEIVLRYEKKDIPLRLKEKLTLSPHIVFESQKNRQYAALTVKDRQGQGDGLLLLRKNVLINPDEQWLSIPGSWKKEIMKFFVDSLSDDKLREFSRTRFHKLPYMTSFESHFILTMTEEGAKMVVRKSEFLVDGRPVELQEVVSEYSIDIMPDSEGYGVLSLMRRINGEEFPFPNKVLLITFNVWQGIFGPLRFSKKQKIFFGTLVNLLEQRDSLTRKGLKDILLDVFLEGHGHISKQSLESYREFISYIVDCIKDKEYNLLFLNDRWILSSSDMGQCLRILAEIYRILDLSSMVSENLTDFVIKVKMDALKRKFSTLIETLIDMGVRVTYRGKKIRQSNWDITIDFQKDIDWFELRPEIKVNDRIIPPDELQRLLDRLSGNMVETEEAIEVLPENVEEVLKLLGIEKGKRASREKREVVQIPRLQILKYLSLRKKGVKLRLPSEEESVIENLLNFKGIESVEIPGGFNGKLRRYQKEGYYWLCFLYEHRFGACLADDMGLGKTIQTITFLGARREGIIGKNNPSLPHLIVVPPSLVFNWEAELRRFYPSFRVLAYTGTDRKLSLQDNEIIITTYAIMRRDIDTLIKHQFDMVVFDEAQTVKNIHAATTSSARRLNAKFKLALTGTPVENHLGEYFSIIDLCLPGLMGDYKEFMNAQKQNSSELLDGIIKRTAPFVLRRTKEEILKELPPKTETDIYLELTQRQKALYTGIVKEIRQEIDEAYETRTEQQAQIVVLAALMKLRRLCLSPALVDSKLPAESPKIDSLIERLFLLREEGHSSLVFSQFTSYLDIVEEKLKASEFNVLRLDGSTPQKRRKKLVRSFQDGNGADVFLLSLKAGGQGLNLTRASYVFHLDPWWNPAVEQQATDRTHRIGQKQKVTVIRLLMQHTIEEKMQELKRRKKTLYEALLGVKKSTCGVKLTREDIEFLLE